jgi:hypothetical protein
VIKRVFASAPLDQRPERGVAGLGIVGDAAVEERAQSRFDCPTNLGVAESGQCQIASGRGGGPEHQKRTPALKRRVGTERVKRRHMLYGAVIWSIAAIAGHKKGAMGKPIAPHPQPLPSLTLSP